MNLKELKKMISEEYTKYLDEQPGGPAGLPPMVPGMDPTVNVSDTDIDMEGGDSEATLRQIYDMLKAYFEGGAGAAAPAGDMGDMDDMEDMEDMSDDMAGDTADDADDDSDDDDDDDDVSEKKEDKEDKEDKKELKERFQKLANIIKG